MSEHQPQYGFLDWLHLRQLEYWPQFSTATFMTCAKNKEGDAFGKEGSIGWLAVGVKIRAGQRLLSVITQFVPYVVVDVVAGTMRHCLSRSPKKLRRQTNERTDGRMEGWRDGWMDGGASWRRKKDSSAQLNRRQQAVRQATNNNIILDRRTLYMAPLMDLH